MKYLGLFWLLIFPFTGISQQVSTRTNSISLHNEYLITVSDTTRIHTPGVSIYFSNIKELESFLDTVPDTFQVAILIYDSLAFLPNNFFTKKQIVHMQIISQKIESLDKRFSAFQNLKNLEVMCDTLNNVSLQFFRLENLEVLLLDVSKYWPDQLKKRIRKIVQKSKSNYIVAGFNEFNCWTGDQGEKVLCTDQ